MFRCALLAALIDALARRVSCSLPPGPGPFTQLKLPQPVPGALRALTPNGFMQGKQCDVSKPPYSAKNNMNATAILAQAIEDCGDLPGGGTVLVPAPLTLLTGSLWLRSNLTLRVEKGARGGHQYS